MSQITNIGAIFNRWLGKTPLEKIKGKESKFNSLMINLDSDQRPNIVKATQNTLSALNEHKSLFFGTGNTRGYIRGLAILYFNTKGTRPTNLEQLKSFSNTYSLGMRNIGAFNNGFEEEYLQEFLSNNPEKYNKTSNGGEKYTKNIDDFYDQTTIRTHSTQRHFIYWRTQVFKCRR